jgi:hypothetical protein
VRNFEILVLYSTGCCLLYSCKQRAGPKHFADCTYNKQIPLGRVTFLNIQNRTVMNRL